MSLPLTFAGRSPFDPIRLRWGGLGCGGMGALAVGSLEPAGIVFGLLLIGLGIATWAFTSFGAVPWHALSPAGRGVAGTGSIIGSLCLLAVFGIFFLTIWVIQAIARNM